MKKTRILSGLLAAFIISASLASCGDKSESSNMDSSAEISAEVSSNDVNETSDDSSLLVSEGESAGDATMDDTSVEESKDEATSEASTDDSKDDSSVEESKEDSSVVSNDSSEESKDDSSAEEPAEVREETYTVDKSGYLSGKQTINLNFNSKTILAKNFKGDFKNTCIDENGRFTLAPGKTNTGTFESEVINVGKFSSMLVSWNAMCGNGKLQVRVSYEASDGTWSDYFSFGTWSDKENGSTSKSINNDYGKMNVDTFTPSKTPTGKIKIKITLNRSGDYYPVLENITIATPEMGSAKPGKYDESAWTKIPMRSQHAPENGPKGNVMCSATTVAMALEHLGTKQTTYETAVGTWDVEYSGYGNWLFSVAEAASHGYYTFCDFYTEDMLKYALDQGYVVGCSTKLTSSGHVVLVVGYETVDGVDYYIVNDPNVNTAKVEVTRYTCDYFNSVWYKSNFKNRGVVYVFQGQY